MKRSFVFAVAALAFSVGGCNWIKNLGKKDNVEPPTPLVDFTPTVQVQRIWSKGVGAGAGNSGAQIAPTVVDGRLYAVVSVNALENVPASKIERSQAEFGGEDVGARLARRSRYWIPDVRFTYGSP